MSTEQPITYSADYIKQETTKLLAEFTPDQLIKSICVIHNQAAGLLFALSPADERPHINLRLADKYHGHRYNADTEHQRLAERKVDHMLNMTYREGGRDVLSSVVDWLADWFDKLNLPTEPDVEPAQVIG